MSVLGSKDPLMNTTVWTSPQVPHCSLGKHISNEAKIIGSRKKKNLSVKGGNRIPESRELFSV